MPAIRRAIESDVPGIVAIVNAAFQRGCTEMSLSTGSVRRELFPYYEKFGYRITSVEPAPAGAPFTKPIEIVKIVKPL